MHSINKRFRDLLMAGSILLLLSVIGCKKFVEVGPPITSTNSANVYTGDATAIAVMTGVYTTISYQNSAGLTATNSITGISLFAGLSADELTLFSLTTQFLPSYYRNDLTVSTTGGEFWEGIYPIIYTCNAAIEGLNSSTGLTASINAQLLGEAEFMRAFCYFYLVNLYGDVPLATGTNYTVNAILPRTPQAEVWQQIISDLKDAQNLLSANYLDVTLLTTTTERVRPTSWAAAALLARTYLYTGDWMDAEAQSTSVINNSSLYSLDSLNGTFLMNSQETIWSLQPVNTGAKSNTGEGAVFVLPATGPNASLNPVYLNNDLLNSFETGDLRRNNWIDSVIVSGITYYYPYKYKIGLVNTATAEYIMVLRLGEQYLIRAEARAEQGDISGAQADLDMIRTRANLPNTTAGDQGSLLSAIRHERQVELFTEWGHRWFDLKRTNSVDSVMTRVTPQKGGSWLSYQSLYPIPQTELNTDPKLVQNVGY